MCIYHFQNQFFILEISMSIINKIKMKVLVIQPKIGMGDMVIYLPYIHAISKKYRMNYCAKIL